jgi:hypothetical protein
LRQFNRTIQAELQKQASGLSEEEKEKMKKSNIGLALNMEFGPMYRCVDEPASFLVCLKIYGV